MKPAKLILMLLTATLMAGLVFASPGPSSGGPQGHFKPGKRSPRSSDGNYQIVISGFYFGRGSGSISDTAVSLTVPLKGDDGTTPTLQADSLAITGTYFSGTGTIGSIAATIQGRLDAPRASRLIATFTTSDGKFGRIAGTLPADPNTDDNWDGPPGPGGPGGSGPGPSNQH